MPNHCHNRVTFYSEDTTVIQRLYNIFKSDNIFTQFIPEPDWKTTPNDKGELPIQPEKDSMMPPQFPDGTTDDKWKEYIPIWQDTTENYKNSLVEQGYVWIDNPFEDWYDDIEPYFHERRLGYYVR